MNSALKCVGSS